MRVLELFSGTGSIGNVCKKYDWEVVSLDLKNADINCNILDWDYKVYPSDYFQCIWSSPPCDTFSVLRKCWIGRKLKCHNGEVCTQELLQKDIDDIGLPILRKTEEIIDYFKPKYWFIENPESSSMKDYIDKPHYIVDYCKYSNWGYQKRTIIWTNLEGFEPKTCNKDCNNMLYGRHIANMGCSKVVEDNGKYILCKTAKLREKYKEYPNVSNQNKLWKTLDSRYRIPPNLIQEMFDLISE